MVIAAIIVTMNIIVIMINCDLAHLQTKAPVEHAPSPRQIEETRRAPEKNPARGPGLGLTKNGVDLHAGQSQHRLCR